MSHLIPEQRTDKNGVTSRRWVRPVASQASTSLIPAPEAAPEKLTPAKQKKANVKFIKEVLISKHVHPDSFRVKLQNADAVSLSIVADAFTKFAHDNEFLSMAAMTASTSSMEYLVNDCVIYDSDLHAYQNDRMYRKRLIRCGLTAAEERYREEGGVDWDEEMDLWNTTWDLAAEDEETRRKVRNYAIAWNLITAAKEDERPDPEVLDRATEDNCEEVVAALRIKPDASVAEIEFLISGGVSSLAEGAL